MLESLVAGILNRFLVSLFHSFSLLFIYTNLDKGNYVENFDPKQLNIGIWSGDVKLNNLRLKKESLDKFELPIDVRFGHLGNLTLQIPWSNLKGKPVKVIIQDVYLLAVPVVQDTYNYEDELKRELAMKLRRLADLELREKAVPTNSLSDEDAAKNESFTESLITKIVDNLQIEIKKIHVMYEDFNNVFTDNPYSIGFTLNELSALSTDENWIPKFIDNAAGFSHKLLSLKSLCAYWNTNTTSIYTDDHDILLEKFKASIIDDDNLSQFEEFTQFILRPVSGFGHVTINKAGATDTQPHIKTKVFFEEFCVDLDSEQYNYALLSASKYHWYNKTHKFKRFRPDVPLENNGKEWFKYAANSVLNEIHEKNYNWSWEFLKKRRDNRKSYVVLWKEKLQLSDISQKFNNKEKDEEFERLQAELSYDDIKFFRSLAKSELRKELILNKSLQRDRSPAPKQQNNGGWLSSWWAGSNDQTSTNESEEDKLVITDEQRQELYDAIEFDESRAVTDAIEVPRDRVNFEIDAELQRGGFFIKNSATKTHIAKIIFEGCAAQHYQRPDSFLSKFTLQEFKVEDNTDTTLYKNVVSVKSIDSENDLPSTEPLFKVLFESNPLDNSADSTLIAKLRSLTIFYHAHFINEIIKFFKPPKAHLDTIYAIMNAAEATVEGLTTQTRLGLEAIWDDHKTLNAQLDLQAPLIILPLDPHSWSSPCAVIDAGHISVTSDPVDKEETKKIKDLSVEEYAKIPVDELNRLIYDRFNLILQDTQILIGPTIKSTIEQLQNKNNSSSKILDKLEMKVLLEMSILPHSTSLAKMKATANLRKFSAKMNDYQYKIMMQLIDKCIPDFGTGDEDDSSIGDIAVPFELQNPDNGSIFGELSDEEEEKLSPELELAKEKYQEQHQFEFKFKIDKLEVALAKCKDGKTMESDPIVNLIAENLDLDFYKTLIAMHLDLSLETFNIEDLIEETPNPEFKKLVSSNNFTASDNIQAKTKIFNLDYQRTLRIVHVNGKEIEVFDQDINLDLSALKIIATRKSLLTILNFILTTFTDPNPVETPADVLRHNDASEIETSPQQIRVTVNLDSISVVLNDEGIKLATLQLTTAFVNVLVLPEKMKVYAKLGALTLHDEVNEGSSRDSRMRKILSFDGDNLAEVTYETFDLSDKSLDYQSYVDFKVGALRINFVEGPINKVFNFLTKFQKMKTLYDTARDSAFNQVNIQDLNMAFNISIESPVFVFPKLSEYSDEIYDDVTFYLGEFTTSNKFIRQENGFINKINCGLRSIRLTSTFSQFNDEIQSLEIIDNVDLLFDIDIYDQAIDRPKQIILGTLSNVDSNLTELQFNYLYLLSQTFSSAFVIDGTTLTEIEESALNANNVITPNATYSTTQEHIKNTLSASTVLNNADPESIKLDVKFRIPQISLTVHDHTEDVKDLSQSAVSKFSLNEIGLDFAQKENSHFKANFYIGALTAEDIRQKKDNKFTEIIPKINGDEHQFSATATTEGPADDKVTFVMVKFNSPKVILSFDYIFALKSFLDSGLKVPINFKINEANEFSNREDTSFYEMESITQESVESSENAVQSRLGFSVNVVDLSLILLADPTSTSSEAIVFKIEQVLLSKQNITSASANNVGMFLCKIDQLEETRIRIIDDFSSSISIDQRDTTSSSFISDIQIAVEPLVMKVSLNDINLAISIFNKAMELSKRSGYISPIDPEDNIENTYSTFSKEFKKKLSKYAPSIISSLTRASSKASRAKDAEVVIKAEKLSADIEGFRLVLIGNVHELPFLDLSVESFQVTVQNWSTDLEADTGFESSIKIYNYAKSSWEPLIEPWALEIHVSKNEGKKSKLIVEFVAKKLAEITLSSRSIALLSQAFSSISGETEIKPRGSTKPYKILNQTGFNINLWTDNVNYQTTIKDGEEVPWEFEDWRKTRENLDITNKKHVLSIELIDSGYDIIEKIPANNEGEEIYLLTPEHEGIHNRLVSEIILGEDNVKRVVLKSTITIENFTQVSVLFKGATKVYNIGPGSSHAVPINEVYNSSFSLKPDIKVPFKWSENSLEWRELSKKPISIRCASEEEDDSTNFFFQVEARYDRTEPLTKVYPHMKVILSAPLEIENLLPYDLGYRLYDRSSKRDWRNFLKKGNVSPVHVVKLEHFLLLSVQPKDSGFSKSDFAIINAPDKSDFKKENRLFIKHEDGQLLNLNIHYSSTKNKGVGVRVVIYSPYIVLNRTGREICVKENYNVLNSNVDTNVDNIHTSVPKMFSFDKRDDVGSRALIKVDSSAWSKPVSFESIGNVSEINVQIPNKKTEMNLGISINEGEGKYKLSKVITLVPRYVIRNFYSEDVEILNIGSTEPILLTPGKIIPLYNLPKVDQKQLQLRFPTGGTPWSSPFNIKDVGQIYIKALKPKIGHILLKIDIVFEDASLFINITDAENHWPFSIRNFSDVEFIFYQKNSYLNESNEYVDEIGKSLKPIYYKIPPKSVMPYAWDYPAGLMKELILRAGGRERYIQLAEIGNLRPMKLPTVGAIVDLNVVADGPTQTLVISNYDPKSSFYKLNDEPATASSLSVNNDKFKAIEEDSDITTQILFKFQGAGISLINTRLQELCYITARGIEIHLNDSDLYQTASWKLKWAQIDNQLFGGIYPIILYPTVVPQSIKEMNNHPAFSGSISKVKDDSHGVTYIKYATTLLQEMSLEIDEDFLFALLDFSKFPGASWNKQIEDKLCEETVALPEPTKPIADSDIYFEVLHIQPTQLNLSFVRTERINVEDKTTSQNAIMFFLNVLTMAIGNINDAPIRMNALLIENVRVPIPTLVQNIQTHYGQNFFYQIHNVLGSADFLGNPVGLFNNVSSGVMDFFYEPYQGLVMNDRPQELGITVAKGGLSFLKKSVFGFSDSVAKFTGSIAKGLTVATLDEEFQNRRRMNQRKNKPKHALYGFSNGATSLVDGVTSGITGIALSPMAGASKEGAQGFFKGIGKGLIGLPTKTAIGIFDLANQVSEGIRNTTLAFDGEGIDKVRLPRFIDHNEIIKPFNERESQGQFWLKTASGGKFINDDYLAHVVLPGEEMVVVVTFTHIVLISTSINEIKWFVEFERIRSITQEKTGIQVGLTDSKNGPFIPIPDMNSRKFLYKKIGVAVNEFNKKCQVVL